MPEITYGSSVVSGPWPTSLPMPPAPGHNLPDPLSNFTRRQIFFACIWLADLSTAEKLFLLCVGRFFDEEARSSSMSYAQVARECGIHESSAKRTAKDVVADGWLKIEIGKGKPTARGPQNLYHGTCPSPVVDELRKQLQDGFQGVASCDPKLPYGVAYGSDGVASGDTYYSLSKRRERAEEGVSYGDPALQRRRICH